MPQEKVLSQADMIKSTKLVSWEGRMVIDRDLAGESGCLTSFLATFSAQLGNSGYPLFYFDCKIGIARTLSLCLLGGCPVPNALMLL